MKFDELGIKEELLDAISYMGFEKASPIQEKSIPVILKGQDLIACAQTGTGKTAAFILPILNKFVNKTNDYTSTLILVPTRELAIQIDREIQGFAYFVPVVSLPIYGGGDGSDWGQQKIALTQGADIIVATPGKLISHLSLGYVKFDKIETLILDEADRMLDIGFLDDILKIIRYIPENRQTLMFSATMAPKIRELTSKILKNPEEISIEISKPAEGVLQAAYLVFDEYKTGLIHKLIGDKPDYESILIFCSTKKKVSELTRSLIKKKYDAKAISSDLEQKEREEVLQEFRSRKVRIIVATDVLSRGIDIKDINLVINFDVPGDAEDYVHRVGRTARASTSGVALTLINEDDIYKFQRIEELIENKIYKIPLPQEIGTGPVWETDFKKKRSFGNKKPSFRNKKR